MENAVLSRFSTFVVFFVWYFYDFDSNAESVLITVSGKSLLCCLPVYHVPNCGEVFGFAVLIL
jgi:hypothetical protein